MAVKFPPSGSIHDGLWSGISVWIAILLIFNPLSSAFGQNGGSKVQPEDFEIPEAFAQAEAVIVSDKGEMDFTVDHLIYRYSRRIYIQDESGLRWAQASILYQPDSREAINNVSARAYRLNAAEEVAIFPINKKTIKDRETANGSREISFSIPFAQVGDIVEYTYEISTYSYNSLRSWNFQREIPVIFSQYLISAPSGYSFSTLIQGDGRQIKRSEGFREAPVYQQLRTGTNTNPNNRPWNITQTSSQYNSIQVYQAVMQPALVREAFSAQPEDYALGIRFQLAKRVFGTKNPSLAFADWSEINKYLIRQRNFFKSSVAESVTAPETNRLIQRNTPKQQVAEYLYGWLRDNFTWNHEYALFAHKLNKVVETRTGTGADLNLLLMAMLRDAGFRTGPVLIATRDQGRIETFFPSLDQFNHVIVWLEIEGRSIFLDATQPDIPFGLLPPEDLNEVGFLVTREEGRFIRIAPESSRERRTVSQMDLLPDGRLAGQVEVYLNAFTRLLENTDDSLATDAEAEVRNRLVTGFSPEYLKVTSVLNLESPQLPLTVRCTLLTEPLAQVPEDFMLLNPMLHLGLEENPLPEGDRQTPIDLNFPIREFYLIGLHIPPGYEVVSMPKPIRVQMTDNAGFFTYNVMLSGEIIHISSVFLINRTHYQPEEYQGLREFFEFMVEKQKESIVLKKTSPN